MFSLHVIILGSKAHETSVSWGQFSAEWQDFTDAQFQNYFGFSLLLCIQYGTDGSTQLIVVDP